MFYGRPWEYQTVMRSAIAINGSFFNTQRMLSQYVTNAYAPAADAFDTVVPDESNGANGPTYVSPVRRSAEG
jgi:hypothetical protein